MKIKRYQNGIELIREKGDKAISHESTVTHHLRRLLNARDKQRGGWTRFYPCRVGLTDCRQGVRRGEVWYWHERHQIELAHQEFNAGRVFYLKA
jgi:hypothetical protein